MNADHIAFLPYFPSDGSDFRFKDLDGSVKEDVEFLKQSPLVSDVPISGYNVSPLLTLSDLG